MVSRAIGDLPYRPFGLISEPDFTEWRTFDAGEFAQGPRVSGLPYFSFFPSK